MTLTLVAICHGVCVCPDAFDVSNRGVMMADDDDDLSTPGLMPARLIHIVYPSSVYAIANAPTDLCAGSRSIVGGRLCCSMPMHPCS